MKPHLKLRHAAVGAIIVLLVLVFGLTAMRAAGAKQAPAKRPSPRITPRSYGSPAGPQGPIGLTCLAGRAAVIGTDGPAGPQGPIGVSCPPATAG